MADRTNVTPIRQLEPSSWLTLPAWVDADRWADWCEHRAELAQRDKASPWNARVERASLRQLERLVKSGAKASALLDDALAYGWRGFWVTR